MKNEAAAGNRPLHRSAGPPLEAFSIWVTRWTGSSWAFALALSVILLWGVTGPVFRFSDTWQLVINTGTTIVTFLMVFVIQRAQNKESKAIQLKLDEIVAAMKGASNRLISAEDLSEREIEVLSRRYADLSRLAAARGRLREALSTDDPTGPGRAKKLGPPRKRDHARSAGPPGASSG